LKVTPVQALENAVSRSNTLLPAQRIDAEGKAHVHWRSVWLLAAPMIANNAIQMVLNLTDTWFIGRISTTALAAMGSVQWLTLVAIMLFGGVGLAVQTVVAQSFGAKRWTRASQAAWIGLWATLGCVPIFIAVSFSGSSVLHLFDIDARIETLAMEFWRPRLFGGFLAVALWAVLGFFNGIGKPTYALWVNCFVGVANIVLNWWFILHLNFGVAGSAWATNLAMLLGVLVGLALFTSNAMQARYRSRLTWRLRVPLLWKQWKLGFPMGLMIAADMVGISLFQLMQVRVSEIDGAATQIAMMLTSIAFMPAVGISIAGTTLVGQSIGAGDRNWAYRIGSAVILLATSYMALVGLLLGLAAPWLFPFFIAANDTQAHAVIQLGLTVMWIAAAYQLFDGLNISSGFCLRGAGDTTVPAILVIGLSWLLFVPIAHMMTFRTAEGWIDGLPQFGFGSVGGWVALLGYIVVLGLAMVWRWRARAWQKIVIQ
jgi:multidrug resistance protein, MATE family